MSVLADFFKGSDTKLGVFYPNHYLVAVFRDPEKANAAVQKLWHAGFEHSDAIATDGSAVVELDKEETGLTTFVTQAMSRFFATEQLFTDHDLHHARRGAGFLAVHCPTEDTKKSAWNIVKGEKPLDARYYGTDGIDHLAGDAKTD
jgi:hypothetical protein